MWARGKPGRKARAAFMNVACVCYLVSFYNSGEDDDDEIVGR